ncbi:MAG: divalent-cation tolerance protein CutA [Candidatus Edwardsbacteria bacterium]|nr:divalent-cation tolerance protein CutA [Candidatus Edwardsbacteria bacterium]
MNCILIYSTFPAKDAAVKAARALLEEQLAAGANLWPLESHFRWQEKIEQRDEWAVLFQAERRFYKRIEARLKQLHPDKVPQIVMWRMKDGFGPFLKWIMDETVRPVEKRERRECVKYSKKAAGDLAKPKQPDKK